MLHMGNSVTLMTTCVKYDDNRTYKILKLFSIILLQPIFVEPQIKEEFHNAMEEFYQKINDPAFKGACFMAVCRGKVKLKHLIGRNF